MRSRGRGSLLLGKGEHDNRLSASGPMLTHRRPKSVAIPFKTSTAAHCTSNMHELHEISSDWVSGGLDIGWMSRFAIAVETPIPGAVAL